MTKENNQTTKKASKEINRKLQNSQKLIKWLVYINNYFQSKWTNLSSQKL